MRQPAEQYSYFICFSGQWAERYYHQLLITISCYNTINVYETDMSSAKECDPALFSK